ncbi:MAG: PAS domain S-box protein [Pseudomonadota bacterium]
MNTIPQSGSNTPGLATGIWLSAYQRVSEGEAQPAILDRVCAELAVLLAIPLVLLGRRQPGGEVQLCGRSSEQALWLELQRMPERWDGTVAGDGPAARALHSGQGCWMAVADAGFLPWRVAAQSDHIAAAGAWPMTIGDDGWLLQLYAAEADWFEDAERLLRIEWLTAELAGFLATEARLRTQTLLAAAVSQAGNACFLTDLEGRICWSNAAFSRLTGYTAEEVRGRNPRFLASGQQGLRYYQHLWNTIRSGQVWTGETVDRDLLGSHYTIRQTISPIRVGNKVSHYLSVHEDISQQREAQRRVDLEVRTDPHSGLLNAASFEQSLQAACTGGTPFTLALLLPRSQQDLTAAMGSEVQYLLAEEQGARVSEHLQPTDAACRLPGGELRLLLMGADEAGHQQRLETLRQALLEPYPLIGEDAVADCRLVALRSASSGNVAEELLRRLDASLAASAASRVPPQPGRTASLITPPLATIE